jgi:ribonucleoside-triphosphate reductase
MNVMLPTPNFGPIGQEVYERTYQRVKSNGEKETWEDTVRRVVTGNTGLVSEQYIEANEREKLFDLIYNFKAIPAGRHLWVSGVPGRQFLFNCHRAAFTKDLADHNTFTFDELMKGGGVGANYSQRYIKDIPAINNRVDVHIVCEETHPDYESMKAANVLSQDFSPHWDGCYRVEDSREGWVDSVNELMWGFFTEEDPNTVNTFVVDVSIVREAGARIRGFGGTASGPIALAQMLMNTARVINAAHGRVLNPLEHMDIDHEIACCVVAGNVRRSARMSILSWQDDYIFDFITCKIDSGKHWTTNISVEIDDLFFLALKKKNHELHEHAKAVYKAVIAGMLENGEPGFYNISLASVGEVGDVGSTNPCGEIALEEWENCNLGHVDISQFHDDFEGAKEAFRLMTRFPH